MTDYSLNSLAEYLGGQIEGDPQKRIVGIADLQLAGDGDITFVAKKNFESLLSSTAAGAVIVSESSEVPEGLNVIRVADPYLAYAKISALFDQRPRASKGIHPTAVIDPSARISESAIVGPFCCVGAHATLGNNTELQAGVFIGAHTSLGDDCLIYANAVIYHGVTIGNRVTVHSNTCIGSDGFGFAPSAEGWQKIHQLGGVIVGNDVEIGACTAIDRGALINTSIADGVIIDNQVHIAHNVSIGERTAIAGCVGIAGSAKVGAGCTMGGFVAINGHVEIADNVHLHGGTIVTKSIKEPGQYASCAPMQEVKKWRKNSVRYAQLDEWVSRIKKLEKGE